MIEELIISKGNALTDGSIPTRLVMSSKLLNIIYHNYETQGLKFTISINDLLRQLNLTVNSGKSKQMVKDAIGTLQNRLELRNFEHKGRGVSYTSSVFLTNATIYLDDKTNIEFSLNDKVISYIEEKKKTFGFTEIDILTTNKFKTKYGLMLYEMYLRYKGRKVQGSQDATYIHKTLEELNKKFHTSYKTQSELMRTLQRGRKEVKKITDVSIFITYEKKEKAFKFLWERVVKKNHKNDLKKFIAWVRLNHKNELLKKLRYKTAYQEGDAYIGVDNFGHVVDRNNIWSFNEKEALEIWQMLFDVQDDIVAFKQGDLTRGF
jgi:hypothetical protein